MKKGGLEEGSGGRELGQEMSGSQEKGSGERHILEPQLASAVCSTSYGTENRIPASFSAPALAASAVHVEVSYGFFSAAGSGDLELGIASPEYCQAEACYASCLGRGERTGGIDVRSDDSGRGISLALCSPSVCVSPSAEFNQLRERDNRLLCDILTGRRELDMVMQQADRENGAVRWIQALDLQVVGACREDERFQLLPGWNVSRFGSDDLLLAHLGQHFKERELKQVAGCLCAPLVSVRVGKVLRQGCTLRPTATRGYLSLTLLPCSELRLSFVGDSGILERIAVMHPKSETACIVLEELSADSSERTFSLKLPEGKLLFFWQSEKVKVTGAVQLRKLKDLLRQQPTLAQLTGIQDSRLDSLAGYVHSALAVSVPLDGSSRFSTPMLGRSEPLIESSFLPPRSSSDYLFQSYKPLQALNHIASISHLSGSIQQVTLSSSSFQPGQARNAAVVGSFSPMPPPWMIQRPRCSEPICSSGTCISSASSVSAGYSMSNLQNKLDVSTLHNAWSTRTSLWANGEDDVEVSTSHSAGLYSSLQPPTCALREKLRSWEPSFSVTNGSLGVQMESSLPSPALVHASSLGSCSVPSETSAYVPFSRSLPAPYPFTLSTPHLPAVMCESSFVPTSASLISLFPPFLPQSLGSSINDLTCPSQESSVVPLVPDALSDPITHISVLGFELAPQNCSMKVSPVNEPSLSIVPEHSAVSQDHQLSAFSTHGYNT